MLMLLLHLIAHRQKSLDMLSLLEDTAGAAGNGGHWEPPPFGVDQPSFLTQGELLSAIVLLILMLPRPIGQNA
jgi:hypothetical protein